MTVRALLTGVTVLLVLVLLVILFQLVEMRQAAHLADGPIGTGLCREGNTLITCHPTMLRQVFPAEKEKGALRIFIVGSSQAMGSPYVRSSFNRISRFFPNEGGLATWLEDYLVFAMPRRRVEIINAAMGNNARMARHLETLREILAKGSPDIIVVMGGNNERLGNKHTRVAGPSQRDAMAAIIYPAYQSTLQTMAREASEAGVRTIFVTLPSNLHDWPPTTLLNKVSLERFYHDIEMKPFSKGKRPPVPEASCQDLRSQWPQLRGDPAAHFSLARCLEAEGNVSQAYLEYVAARDLDLRFVRVRSVQNESIRALRGPGVSVLDLEALMRGYTHNGIPGYDLFLDHCHMSLRGNKISGFEIAREVLRLEGVPIRDEKLRRAPPLRIFNRWALWWLHWLRTIKWTLYRFLPASWQQFGPRRGGPLANSSLLTMRDIDMIGV
ncbi:MAG: hypothetical protein ABH891_07055 [Candidatus Omnitrophota bacterium]